MNREMTDQELAYNKMFIKSLLIQWKHGNKKFSEVKSACQEIVNKFSVKITKERQSNEIHINNLPMFN